MSFLTPEMRPSGCVEILLGAAQQLQQYTFLNVKVFIYRGRDGSSETFVTIRLRGQRLEQLHALRRKLVLLAENTILYDT